ncbi:C4-dicarboxylate transport protein [Flavobacteriaceae bacterium UJ101]|nr:C4-dicarboxylate transport protein [Flavobacteriaceae bacterium UJ101]
MKIALHWRILIGIVAGLIFGLGMNFATGGQMDSGFLYGIKTFFSYMGEIFVRLLKMMVVPLVFASIYMAIVNLENIAEIGKIGKKTIGYYFLTTALAVGMGIVVVNIIQPGNVDAQTVEKLKAAMDIPAKVAKASVGEKNSVEIVVDTIVGMIPKNPISALANTEVLQVIFFAIFIALVSVNIPVKSKAFADMVSSVDAIMQKGVGFIMKIAPFFLFFLVGGIFMKVGMDALAPLLKYAGTVLIGLGLHGFVTLPLLVWIFTKTNPYKLLRQMTTPLLTAWATASSAATLPVTMRTLEEEVGVNPKVSNFVLPLGATINMDGTALYESIAVIFIAGILGIDLSFGDQIVIFITASLAAMGAAAIPGAGLVTMGIVLSAVGMPLDAIGIILAVDALLDQFRTAINVWGDGTASYVINHSEKDHLDGELDGTVTVE